MSVLLLVGCATARADGLTRINLPLVARDATPTPTLTLVPSPTPTVTRTPSPTPTATPAPQTVMNAFEQRVFDLTNAERTRAGLAPLRANAALTQAAHDFAGRMGRENFFDHTAPDGSTPSTRAVQAGYRGGVGENIAAGYRDPESVVAGWMASPGHRANILRADYRDIGVGYQMVPGSTYSTYWVQDFGIPSASALAVPPADRLPPGLLDPAAAPTPAPGTPTP